MAKSIRISDELYSLALTESVLDTRSLAQQIEHWAKIGLALERANSARAREASIEYQRWSHEDAVATGRIAPQALLAIPASVAKSSRVVLPADAFSGNQGW